MQYIKYVLSIAVFSICCSFLFSQPVKIEIYGNQILEKSYIGNGVQWSAYPQFDISEKSWQRVFERTDFMRLNFIRLVLNANEYCKAYPMNGKPVFDFNDARILRVCRILDYCQKKGVDVILGEWGNPRMDGITIADPRWTEIVGGFLDYLVNVKKYTCIKYYNLGNEPNNKDGYVDLWKAGSIVNFENWHTSILNLHNELVKRGLWYGLFSSTPILPMSWWWEYFEDRGMNPYFKGVREISDQMLTAGNGSFEKISVKADSLEAFSIKCGDKLFVYLYNKTKSDIKSDISINETKNTNYRVQSFSTMRREYKDLDKPTYSSSGIGIEGLALNPEDEIVLILTSY